MLERAKFIINDKKTEIGVMFNPESYTVESSVQYGESSAIYQGIGIVQFNKISPRTMSVDLYFDTLNGPPFSLTNLVANIPIAGDLRFLTLDDVSVYTEKFHDLIKWRGPKVGTPIVTFFWGSSVFEGVITKITEKFTMFRPDGIPVRASVSISMTEYTAKMAAAKNAFDAKEAAKKAAAKVASSSVPDVSEQQKAAATAVAQSL